MVDGFVDLRKPLISVGLGTAVSSHDYRVLILREEQANVKGEAGRLVGSIPVSKVPVR